jgi:hypothetical protein
MTCAILFGMKRKRTAPPKVQPWPGSVFALKTKWEDWITDRHLWVFLERRAPGKFGRLEAMHAIVPKGRKKSELATLFGSAKYRRGTLDGARELFRSAGVPDDQAADFMQTITKNFLTRPPTRCSKKRFPTRCSRWRWATATKNSATIGPECRN